MAKQVLVCVFHMCVFCVQIVAVTSRLDIDTPQKRQYGGRAKNLTFWCMVSFLGYMRTQVGISNGIPQYYVGCNYLFLPEMTALAPKSSYPPLTPCTFAYDIYDIANLKTLLAGAKWLSFHRRHSKCIFPLSRKENSLSHIQVIS